MSVFRQVVPNSFQNETNRAYEYFLIWLSPEGGVRSWLFSHTIGNSADSFSNTIVETINNIRAIPTMERESVIAMTGGIDSETFEYVKSIMASNRVYQVSAAGVKTPIAISGSKIIRDNRLKDFGLNISFTYKEKNILNV